MKIIFIGTPQIAADILSDLIKNDIQVSSVITQPDKNSGRKKQLLSPAVKILAEKNSIPVFQPQNKEELIKIIKNEKPDICVVAAFGMIIPKEALEIPQYGMINFHPSLLPKYRGPAPIISAILNGDTKTGVSIIQMNEKMDEGDIIAQKEIPLKGTETNPELEETTAKLGAEMITRIIKELPSSINSTKKQIGKISYTKIIDKKDGEVNWSTTTAQEIERMSRAFQPWPGIYSFWNNKKIDFYDISCLPAGSHPVQGETLQTPPPGNVEVVEEKMLIGTIDGTIFPAFVKIEGKNKMTVQEFLKGHPNIDQFSAKKTV